MLGFPTLIYLDVRRENMKSQDNNPKFKSGASRILQDEHKELHHNILSDFTHQCKQI